MQASPENYLLLGPFHQIVTMAGLPAAGPLQDHQLEVLEQTGIVLLGEKIVEVGTYAPLAQKAQALGYAVQELTEPLVLLPGFIDAHTHLCFAGSRANDFAQRVAGKTYLEIARNGGGILDTVRKTRAASPEELAQTLHERCQQHLSEGVTTCEVKSGYGLTVADELKMLEVINQVHQEQPLDLVPTCLAAHMRPPEFSQSGNYLTHIAQELLPQVKARGLAQRVDIFVEDTAFTESEAIKFLQTAKALGFDVTVHADQFSTGGSQVAAQVGAVSADHLEASDATAMLHLKEAGVVATVLPGASLGLGMHFAPARQLLDHGLCVAVATDWNPGSAPMGDLLLQAALLGAAQKLTLTETLAGITHRAALALGLTDRGIIAPGFLADMVAFPTSHYQEVLYRQGKLKPAIIWKRGRRYNLQQPLLSRQEP
ncbi:imidazolonepropionase [Rufibacter immobilis]|uniref:Imidazolonepropionase n=1 Tax=Rufibacter immobilis TaxID=1348778 RepID=A0A3M9MS12_9BACT|nr:imidazolonepropionase [Rufibacter immobilis]RNI28300.1 imidazolonepropionase [Rufibacter immobilis]